MVFHQTWESWAVSSKNSFLMWELMHCRRSPNCAGATICGFSYCCPQIKPQQQNKKAQPIKGCGGKFIGLQPGSMVTLSVCVQGRTATFVCLHALLCEHAFIWLFLLPFIVWVDRVKRIWRSVYILAFISSKFVSFRLLHTSWWGYIKECKCFSSSPLVGSCQQAFH